ncbi:hypothetical protein Tco_0495513, partial [Tanacetum coccineum]
SVTGVVEAPYLQSSFSGGGDDDGSVAANSVMPALADGDHGVWC